MTSRLTDADLAAIEARANAASPGPWIEGIHVGDGEWAFVMAGPLKVATIWSEKHNGLLPSIDDPKSKRDFQRCKDTRAFIAASRADIPSLLRDLRDARAALAEADAQKAPPKDQSHEE